MSDARISTGLPSHPKTKKLLRRLGPAGPWALVCLFLWARDNRADGDLSGMTDEDIELASDWSGEEGAFVASLVSVGFVDGDECARSIHDWSEHQPWSAGADDRKQSSAWAAMCKRYGRDGAAERMPEYAARMRKASVPAADAMRPACGPHAPRTEPHATPTDPQCPATPQCPASVSVSVSVTDTTSKECTTCIADSPSAEPSVSDVPADELEGRRKRSVIACPVQRIADLWDEVLPELRSPIVWNDARKTAVSTRWREMAVFHGWKTQDEGVDWFRRTLVAIRGSPFLMGKVQPRDRNQKPFALTLDWMFGPKNFLKIVEGRYHEQL